jgi:hypothetical protein
MFVDAKRDMMLMELHAQVRLYQLIDIWIYMYTFVNFENI